MTSQTLERCEQGAESPPLTGVCRIAFWNVNGKDLTDLVAQIAISYEADVIVLLECNVPTATTLQSLQTLADNNFHIPEAMSHDRFHCFSRNVQFDLTEAHEGYRTSFRRLNIGSTESFLGLIHGVDMRNNDLAARQSVAQRIADDVRFVKKDKGTDRLILMGDFNMNPFEPPMNLAAGFNAMITKACTERRQRQWKGEKYDFFYNPMWSLLGDGSDGPAGTFYDTSDQGTYGWSMLDQVILNHSLVKVFQSVRILTQAGTRPLLDSRGRPDKIHASDHLPIMVELKEIEL